MTANQTREEILRWLEEGRAKQATHLLVVADLFTYENYPVYVLRGQNAFLVADDHRTNSLVMRKLMGIFSYALPIGPQLAAPDRLYFETDPDLTPEAGDAPLMEFPLDATHITAGRLERLLGEPHPELSQWRQAVRQQAHRLRELLALVTGDHPNIME